MKRVLAILAVSLAASAHAQSGLDMKDMDMQKAPDAAKRASHAAAGTVQKIDAGKGTVTIAHGAIESLKWPAMTMTFAVQDKKLLENVRAGTAVKFELVQQGSSYVVTSIH